jgi:dihydrolipoamide dehydrogenase
VHLYRGRGRFKDAHTLRVEGAEQVELSADYVLIATGSTPRIPEGVEVDGEKIATSDHVERWPDFPESMVIVGSGVVGCEYATIFGNYGRTKISMIDRQARILPFEDEDVSSCITQNFEEMGVRIHRKAKLVSMSSSRRPRRSWC